MMTFPNGSALFQDIVLVAVTFLITILLWKQGVLPGQQQAMTTMRDTINALTVRLELSEKNAADFKVLTETNADALKAKVASLEFDLSVEKNKNSDLTLKLVESNTALALAATKFLIETPRPQV